MRCSLKKIVIAAGFAIQAATAPAFAQADVVMSPGSRRPALMEEYTAYIGRDDLFNSSGEALTRPWQIIRQDRANFHLYGVRQRGDQGDTFFGSKENRARLESMIAAGRMSREAASAIMEGGALLRVQIWGHRGVGDYVSIEVE
jgi:hypothetical protein